MNVNNFIVRPKRKLVEKYADAAAWEDLGPDERNELVGDVAGLPSELVDQDLEAKQFDLHAARPESIPDLIDLTANFAGKHRSNQCLAV